ncbi:hypothetical protein DCC85_21035 [Paenibacillus sp. CAA11]|uniref:sugar transferase n=1 Tax=Paenibacillus sp. CAA11 TaxID=1532905 RepID=UPI000D34C220|nr:sugar transferase [Paenibacillus sp. CAA11]AWB46405.1 hypothetical protein DCC85_21035 [Paenibacillus sp. CAA11]
MRLFRWSSLKAAVLLLDILFVYGVYLLAYGLKFPSGIPVAEWTSFLQYAPWLGVLTVSAYYLFHLYDFAGRQQPGKLLYNLVLAHAFIAVFLIVLNYWLKTFSLPRTVVFMAFLIQIALTFGVRLLLFLLQRALHARRRALVVTGTEPSASALLDRVNHAGSAWFDIIRVLRGQEASSRLQEGIWDQVDVLMIGQGVAPSLRNRLIRMAGERRIEVLLVPDFYELTLQKAETQQLDDLLLYSLLPPQLDPWERLVKRAADVIFSLALLILASPVMLLLCVLIPLTSKGSAFFVQERLGRYERPFLLYKFRSMVENAEAATGPVLAGAADARITRLGQWIRATRLDELPQLINVLLGHMSLVGPRPERAFFTERFKEELPHYSQRFMVKPGLTGLAQVMGNYTTDPSDKLRFDLMYINSYSPLLDLQIMLQTLRVMVHREPARGVVQKDAPLIREEA